MYQLKYRNVWIILGLLLVGAITYLSLIPSRKLPSWDISDKLVHFAIYFTVSLWFVGIIKQKFYLLMGILFLLFSGGIEVLQGRTTYRSFEWLDMFANGAGILCAILLGVMLFKGWCQYIEKKIFKVQH